MERAAHRRDDALQLDAERRLEAYRRMVRIRCFEEAVVALPPGEVLGMSHSSIGQEAAIVGACIALRDDDYITGTHRSHGHPIGKGSAPDRLMAELLGRSTGVCQGRGGSMHLADVGLGVLGESAIVAGGIPLATGAALSIRVRATDQVSLCFFGDGAANEGVFHESLNMAALWRLPVVYFCENNLYAATTPLAAAHAVPDIARRADAFGIPGVAVDGQDVDAVYAAARDAVERARSGGGPALIEARTYRIDEHSTNLFIPFKYRSDAEIDYYRSQRDPLELFRARLLASGCTTAQLAAIAAAEYATIEAAVAFARDSAYPEPDDVYRHMYGNPIGYPAPQR